MAEEEQQRLQSRFHALDGAQGSSPQQQGLHYHPSPQPGLPNASTPTRRGAAASSQQLGLTAGSEDEHDEDEEETDDGNERKRKHSGSLQGRAKKPHLQGRFSGRLPTKDDEKRLAEECRLLGPMLGGSGKRGDKSRLTLAKIVRGIASGEIRRFCEDRERILQEARRIVASNKQSGGADVLALQQEVGALRKELEAKTQAILHLEKLHMSQKLGPQAGAGGGPSGGFVTSQHVNSMGGMPHQGMTPQALQQQLADLAAQHRQALLMAKACIAQVQTMSLEQQELEANMDALQREVNKLVQRREELSNDEVVRLRLLDSELSKVQLHFQRNAKGLAEMRDAALRAEAQATAHAQSHSQVQASLDMAAGSKPMLNNAGLFSDSAVAAAAAAVQQAAQQQQQQQGQAGQQPWSLQPASSAALDFTSQVRMLEAGSGPPYAPRISLLDQLATPRISLLDPLTTAPSLPLGGGPHSLSGGRLSASQLDMRGPAFYTLNMLNNSNGVGQRLSHLGHHQHMNSQLNMNMPMFQLNALRNLGQVGVDGLGQGSTQGGLELPSSAALGGLTSAWGQAALNAAAAAVQGNLTGRGSSGSGSTMFGAVMQQQAQQQAQQQQQHAQGQGHGKQQQQQQSAGGSQGQPSSGQQQQANTSPQGQQSASGILTLGSPPTTTNLGRLQLTGDGLPPGASVAMGLNLSLANVRKVEV